MINWMRGSWYDELAYLSDLSVDLILELVNTIFQFKLQSILSSIIRIAEIKNEERQISQTILSWTKMFQYGLDSQLKLDLLEIGLGDRMGILFLDKYCISKGYNHKSKDGLKKFIKTIIQPIYEMSPLPMPKMAFSNLINFLNKLN